MQILTTYKPVRCFTCKFLIALCTCNALAQPAEGAAPRAIVKEPDHTEQRSKPRTLVYAPTPALTTSAAAMVSPTFDPRWIYTLPLDFNSRNNSS